MACELIKDLKKDLKIILRYIQREIKQVGMKQDLRAVSEAICIPKECFASVFLKKRKKIEEVVRIMKKWKEKDIEEKKKGEQKVEESKDEDKEAFVTTQHSSKEPKLTSSSLPLLTERACSSQTSPFSSPK